MSVGRLLALFEGYGERTAMIWRGQSFSYEWLQAETSRLMATDTIRASSVVALSADYSPKSLAHLFALLGSGSIVCLITRGLDRQKEELLRLAQVETEIVVDHADGVSFRDLGHEVEHPLLLGLRGSECGGLVLFSSGSAGKIKAVVHDAGKILAKYQTPRRAKIMIPFMLFDHIGGVHTLLLALSSGGTLVAAPDRSPETICTLVEKHRVEVLPATPTFLNLFLLSDWERYDLSSLEYITYSAERMPAEGLARLRSLLPGIQLAQNYGLSETGIMKAKSESSESLFMKLGGEGFETRVRDGLLEIKAETAMMGYLNEANPFTEDGWLKTGDRVEVKGEYMKVLGRQSDIIIIGGEKVYPAEVEDLIATMPNVLDVIVSGEANAITGQIVRAEVQLAADETRAEFRRRMTTFLADKLAPFKIPQRVKLTKEPLYGTRLKKRRR